MQQYSIPFSHHMRIPRVKVSIRVRVRVRVRVTVVRKWTTPDYIALSRLW